MEGCRSNAVRGGGEHSNILMGYVTAMMGGYSVMRRPGFPCVNYTGFHAILFVAGSNNVSIAPLLLRWQRAPNTRNPFLSTIATCNFGIE